jgi:hypothetical protein
MMMSGMRATASGAVTMRSFADLPAARSAKNVDAPGDLDQL